MNPDHPPATTPTLEELARQAVEGDRDALDRLLRSLQGALYGLALRMLWNRENAEDATQEILVRIVTRLSQFNFDSRVKTWAYRIAVNYVLDFKKSAVERLHVGFERFAEDLEGQLQPASADDAEQSLLIDEVKVGCSLAMLQCLDRPHRLAYVLGDIMELSGPEAAEILEINPALLRKRLQVAREQIRTFMRAHCGLVSDAAPCQCNRHVRASAARQPADTQPLHFARRSISFKEARALVRRVDEARWALEVHRTSQPRATSVAFAQQLLSAIDRSVDGST